MVTGYCHPIAEQVVDWLRSDPQGVLRFDATTLARLRGELEQATGRGEGALAAGALLELSSVLRQADQQPSALLLSAVALAALAALANPGIDVGAAVDHALAQSAAFKKFAAESAEPSTAPKTVDKAALLGSLGRLKNF